MLSIDEAIAHAKEVASRKFDDRIHCISCAEEHEQLVELLEELKAYREIGTVEGYKNAIECYTREYTIRKSNIQYDKAIDEEVSDNMCEWRKFNGNSYLFETSCGNISGMYRGFNFCPYCGKKIKVVE